MLTYIFGLAGQAYRLDWRDPSTKTTGVIVADEDILTTIALTLATNAVGGLAEGGKAAFAALARLVRRRFQGHASAQATLTEAAADPADDARILALREELAQATADDPVFDHELRRLWHDLGPHLVSTTDGVANSISGSVGGNVVQARDVHGGISFGETIPHNPDARR